MGYGWQPKVLKLAGNIGGGDAGFNGRKAYNEIIIDYYKKKKRNS